MRRQVILYLLFWRYCRPLYFHKPQSNSTFIKIWAQTSNREQIFSPHSQTNLVWFCQICQSDQMSKGRSILGKYILCGYVDSRYKTNSTVCWLLFLFAFTIASNCPRTTHFRTNLSREEVGWGGGCRGVVLLSIEWEVASDLFILYKLCGTVSILIGWQNLNLLLGKVLSSLCSATHRLFWRKSLRPKTKNIAFRFCF